MSTDWLPRRRGDQLEMAKNWQAVLTDKGTKWNIPAPEVTILGEKITTAADLFDKANSAEATATVRAECNLAFDSLIDYMRMLKKRHFFTPPLYEPDFISLGLKPQDTTPTMHPRPTSQPDTVIENTKNHYEHKIIALNPDGKAAIKPADAYGVHYGWQVGGEKPASGADLPKGHFSRKTTHVVTYTEADKGKPAYYATCYENSKGEAGPYSTVVEAFIG